MGARIKARTREFPGVVSVFAKNLDTGRSFALRADDRVRTASTIKLPIMVAVFAAVEEGRARWTDTLTLRDADKVSGSGVVRELSDGLALPLRDLVHLMVVVSDNTATNLLLDRFGADAVNAQLDNLGLSNTRSLRKIMGDRNALKDPSGWSDAGKMEENKRFGIGYSTPRDMVALLEMLESGIVVSAAASKAMLEILERQQYKDGIGRRWRLRVASKSGALDALRSDVGIVYTKKGRLALAITIDGMKQPDWSPDNQGNKLISEITGTLLAGLAE
jgi:beta-lactamase class A